MKQRHEKNKSTRQWARQLQRGHKFAGFALLLGGFLLAAGAGLLPLLLDFASNRAVAALPQPHSPAMELGVSGAKIAGALLTALLAALLCAPLRLGREAWYFGGADGRKRSSARVTFWMQPRWAVKAARFVLAVRLRKLLWAALYLTPGGFLLGGTLLQARGGEMDLPLFLGAAGGGAALLVLGAFFCAATAQRYALVLPILAKQPRCKLRNALALSAARTNESCAALLGFKLSFFPWYLLCLLVVPLPFVAPYIAQAKACRHAELLQGGIL